MGEIVDPATYMARMVAHDLTAPALARPTHADHAAGMRLARQGALWAAVGAVVAGLSFAVAEGSLGHVVGWGAIAFGLADVARGVALITRWRR
ncbi:MAG: hypothetical protein WKG00_20470 [Polyangiaceae bacterium]